LSPLDALQSQKFHLSILTVGNFVIAGVGFKVLRIARYAFIPDGKT
jgi:hypothetical protein